MSKTLTFFALNSLGGKALQEMLIALVDKEYQWKIVTDKTVNTFMHACNHDDVVILDATIEEGGLNNYSRISLHPMVMNHILVVSRSYLPMNYRPLYEGGAPQFPYPYADLDDTTPYIASDETYSNEMIMRWLLEKLPTIRPRRALEKGFLGSLNAMNKSLDGKIQSRKEAGQVFISYRSKGIKDIGYEPAIEPIVRSDDLDVRGTGRLVKNLVELKKRIRQGVYHGGSGKSAFFVMPGALAYPGELLTQMRRWQVLSLIDDAIRGAEEFWVYDTEGYKDSWWTQGELVLWAFLRAKNRAPQLRIYDYRTDSLREPPPSFVPTLTKEQYRRVDRLGANTDPDTMPADAAEETLRQLAKAPVFNRMAYVNDPIWSPSFWTDLLLQCECTYSSSGSFDIDRFLSIQDPVVSPELLAEAVHERELTCPNPGCGRRYSIMVLPPRYRWMPARGGKFVKPGENALVEYPTLRAVQQR